MKSMEKGIFDYLAGRLSPKRFEHSYNVSVLAAELAEIYGVDALKAQTAGLLHDCSKSMTDRQMTAYCKNKKIKAPYLKEISAKAPHLLHSFIAADIAAKKFKISDPDMLNAIKNHTLGRENMSLLEKILFVSDAVSRDRKYAKAAVIRKLAKKNIDKALMEVLSNKIRYVVKEREWLCPQTIAAWNYYASES